mmetsp:Transcript_49761/g.155720  ORF Transcript_49761/g.155720 Transcript_49761/m.155720 type:complete len:113 (+) Transcript_49761:927-1265(+)
MPCEPIHSLTASAIFSPHLPPPLSFLAGPNPFSPPTAQKPSSPLGPLPPENLEMPRGSRDSGPPPAPPPAVKEKKSKKPAKSLQEIAQERMEKIAARKAAEGGSKGGGEEDL